jgi:hypothetical protein
MIAAKTAELAPKKPSGSRSRAPTPALEHPLHQLHAALGNQAVQRMYKSGQLPAKLGIGKPGDRFELDADRVADQVMRLPEPVVQMKPG